LGPGFGKCSCLFGPPAVRPPGRARARPCLRAGTKRKIGRATAPLLGPLRGLASEAIVKHDFRKLWGPRGPRVRISTPKLSGSECALDGGVSSLSPAPCDLEARGRRQRLERAGGESEFTKACFIAALSGRGPRAACSRRRCAPGLRPHRRSSPRPTGPVPGRDLWPLRRLPVRLRRAARLPRRAALQPTLRRHSARRASLRSDVTDQIGGLFGKARTHSCVLKGPGTQPSTHWKATSMPPLRRRRSRHGGVGFAGSSPTGASRHTP